MFKISKKQKNKKTKNKKQKIDEIEQQAQQIVESLKDKNQDDIQIYLFSMLSWLINILEKEHIFYVIMGGTLLGAVRENDIIPFDDDADIGFLAKDYDRVIQLIQQYTDQEEKYSLDKYSYFDFYKLRDVSVDFRNRIAESGVESPYIDLLRLDNVSQEDEERAEEFYSFGDLNIAVLSRDGMIPNALTHETMRPQFFEKQKLSVEQLLHERDHFVEQTNQKYKNSNVFAYLSTPYGVSETYWQSEIEGNRTAKIRSLTIRIPEKSEEILKRIYGEDWQTPLDNKTHFSS